MATVLGIDTGGTYTDGVVMDIETKTIFASAKAPTTHYDLTIGIRHCLENLQYHDFKAVSYVSLSTTLATNAIVEGKGGQVGLIMLGAEVDFPLPECVLISLPGGHDIQGNEVAPLDIRAVEQAVESLDGRVSAVAISSFLSVRNPEHEMAVKEIVQKRLKLPIVSAHELTTSLGFAERTVTAVLNGRLLSTIDHLMTATKEVLSERGLQVPIMIVKGDGSLMNESVAKERPIETILSGPAASIIGATFLNEAQDGLVLDMGGTTTDIAILQNGLPRIDPEGATVGGWLTRVRAAQVNTFGLGGDSRISYETFAHRFVVGPRRVRPISAAALDHPNLIKELEIQSKTVMSFATMEPTDCLYLLREPEHEFDMTELELSVIEALGDSAHTYTEVGRRIGYDPNLLSLERLIRYGIVGVIGLTPTDILHYSGEYGAGNVEAARVAIAIQARYLRMDEQTFVAKVKEAVYKTLCYAVLNSAIHYEGGPLEGNEFPLGMEYFLEKARNPKHDAIFITNVSLRIPIIGIGAPVSNWLPTMSEELHANLILPPYSEVANAVGAAVGKVMDICRITVASQGDMSVVAFTPWGRYEYKEVETAVTTVAAMAKERIAAAIERKGVHEYDVLVNRKDREAFLLNADNKMHIETNLEIVAVGRPAWGSPIAES